MKNSKLLLSILLVSFVALTACKEDGDDFDNVAFIENPQEYIVGKWKEIACGNSYYPELGAMYDILNTIEFFPNGIYSGPYGLYGSWDDGTPTHYRMGGDSLYMTKEGQEEYIFRYLFMSQNQILLQHVYGFITFSMATPTFHIYQRIK
ncbi:MAG: hypothetical protein LBJ39_06215 [Tannerellaceae bacterium]|jgi:hypothetical protein|nr:hypothetical protein [Tannerellaceae bacterium]